MSSEQNECPPEMDGDATAACIPADPALLADGWERRHLVDPQRAEESVELYTSLGYEVKAQQLTPADFGPNCKECAAVVCRTHVLIYTRKKDSTSS